MVPPWLNCRAATPRPSAQDFKTGQTLNEDGAAPALKARMLGVSGWFSTNILGNRDGEVLGRSAIVQDERGIEAGFAGYISAGALSRSLQEPLPQDSHQILPAPWR